MTISFGPTLTRRKSGPGETLCCNDCDCTWWAGELCCWLCGKPGLSHPVMKQLRTVRALQDEGVPV